MSKSDNTPPVGKVNDHEKSFPERREDHLRLSQLKTDKNHEIRERHEKKSRYQNATARVILVFIRGIRLIRG